MLSAKEHRERSEQDNPDGECLGMKGQVAMFKRRGQDLCERQSLTKEPKEQGMWLRKEHSGQKGQPVQRP